MSIYTGDEEVHKNFTILARDGTPVRGEDDPPGFFISTLAVLIRKYIYTSMAEFPQEEFYLFWDGTFPDDGVIF